MVLPRKTFQKSQYNNKKGLEIATEQCKDKLSNFGGIFVTLGKVLELSKFSGFVFNSSYSKYSCTHHICKNKIKKQLKLKDSSMSFSFRAPLFFP